MTLLKIGQNINSITPLAITRNYLVLIATLKTTFILDYKEDQETRTGLRTVFEYAKNPEKVRLLAGAEYQIAWLDAKNYGNVAGERDTIRFADELTNADFMAFANLQYFINPTWTLELGLSYANTSYDINRTVDRINNNPQAFQKQFDPSFNPRLAISKIFSDKISAHLSVSTGYSVPTTSEVRTNEGS